MCGTNDPPPGAQMPSDDGFDGEATSQKHPALSAAAEHEQLVRRRGRERQVRAGEEGDGQTWRGMATGLPCLLGQTLRKHRRATTTFLTRHNLVRAATWFLQTSCYESRKCTKGKS